MVQQLGNGRPRVVVSVCGGVVWLQVGYVSSWGRLWEGVSGRVIAKYVSAFHEPASWQKLQAPPNTTRRARMHPQLRATAGLPLYLRISREGGARLAVLAREPLPKPSLGRGGVGHVTGHGPCSGLAAPAPAATETPDESVNTPASRTTNHAERRIAAPTTLFGPDIFLQAYYVRPVSLHLQLERADAVPATNKTSSTVPELDWNSSRPPAVSAQHQTAIAPLLALLSIARGHAVTVLPPSRCRCHRFVLV